MRFALVLSLVLSISNALENDEAALVDENLSPSAQSKARDARAIFGIFGKKPTPVEEPPMQYNTAYNTGGGSYGIKTKTTYGSGSTGGGYPHSSGYGGYGGQNSYSGRTGYGGHGVPSSYIPQGGYASHDHLGSFNQISYESNSQSTSQPSNTGLIEKARNWLGYGGGGSSSSSSSAQLSNDFMMHRSHPTLPLYGSCPSMSLPANVLISCRSSQCDISCPASYSFPNGQTVLSVKCVGREWVLLNSDLESVPPCQASCEPACQNNGICDKPGFCKCPTNFYGAVCQYKQSICASKPQIPKNSKVSCVNNVCNAECMRGFQFSDGSTITNIECQDGEWRHKKTGSTKIPDCMPICEPACANGGNCISFNVCNCTKDYRGDHCQYNIDVCNVNKTNFNGEFRCSFGSDEAKCKFSCSPFHGLRIEGNVDIEYKCAYNVGEFMPKPIPQCIYPPGVTISRGSTSSQYTRHETHFTGGSSSGSVYGVQYTTELERMMAIIAKYRAMDTRSEWWSSEENLITPSSYSLYVSGSTNLVIDNAPRPAMCVTWGGINMKTFDGLVFKAPLSCSHTLITDKQDSTFDLTLKACPFGSGYGCAHSLKIHWQSVLYTFENLNGTIRLSTPTKNLPTPVQIMGMQVLPVAQHLQINLESVGLRIDWDRAQYIAMHASQSLWGKLGGLCGSLDGDYKNDLQSKHGGVLQTIKAFTDSWRVEDKSDQCLMDNSAELEFGSQSCEASKHQKAFEVCEHLLANEKLTDCIKLFNFEALLKTCVDDYCNCPNREHPETCNCDAISMLAKECMFKNIKLEHGWRKLDICPITCSYGRFYQPCGPDVEPTCDSAVIPSQGKCNEGCFCPEGTVQYKDACITPELCPCTMRGKEFKPDATIKKNCNKCTCKNGQWKCSDEDCGARCGAIGDPHYQTFDGQKFNFMGKCSYYLLKTPNISVEAENVACSGAISENLNFAVTAEDPSCTKSLTIRFVLKNGVAKVIKLAQGLATYIDDKEITKFPKILGAGEVLLRQASSTFMTVEFPGGIRVWWDGVSRAYIDAPPSYRGRTAGLCGTFNSNTKDDYLTPEGDIETAVEPFADKWRTKDTCDFLTETVAAPHPCTVNPDKRDLAEKHCAWLTEAIFQDCHWTVEPEQYYEDCIYDVCACKNDPATCFCPILSAYGEECARQGIKTGWRLTVKECAIQCPLGQVYDECGDSCTRSCEDLASKYTCKKECVEGCRCPHGEYLNEQNECVPQSKCHCNYDGVSFKPGYKEVRPGEKFLDLCTCENGLWMCEDAEAGDKEKYPPSSELRAECAKQPFAEFSKCAPKEPKTCKNMHEYVADHEDCAPACVCMAGYVYDMSRKACVLPEACSCHHGGRSYNDGEKMKEDCSLCVCQSGKWQCTSSGCEATCSVWGDSHFTTFDNHDYDFQGECDYVLAKGAFDNGDGFAITIQNVLCGTMGVTCSKSVKITLTGSIQDTLVLSKDATFDDDQNNLAIKRLRDVVNEKSHGAFHIYKAGVFIAVEIIPLKLQVKWDEGTRVYVKLGSEWKQKVSGLCGNYNDNAMDDMQTPTQSLETSPLIFGHSWKVLNYCATPTQPIDACKQHAERQNWAEVKCGILKSPTFQDCHGKVSVEKYLKRCIYDTCACDQGGDCECLCTAISAYAHTCSQKGINIRWRTPHFCPMQCDPHCSEYKSCTPACAVETCDNFLDQGITERICNKENCIEGCAIKPCDVGMIYLNDTYKECVPKSECKPICLVRDGKTYYEGDVTYMDTCSTCHCSKRKEVCSGVKCSESPTTAEPILDGSSVAPPNTEPQAKCVKGWTRWFDKDSDSSTSVVRLNDEEKLPRYDRMESIYGTCQKQYMKKIECRVLNTHESSDYMNENVFCNIENGLVCVGECHDYEIRVFCQCDELPELLPTTTEKPPVGKTCDTQLLEYKEYPGDCHKFLHCQPNTESGWTYVEKTCGEYMMFNPVMNVCDHIATVQDIKPSCGKATIVPPQATECADGKVMSECANQCEHTCHYFGMILKKRGLCQQGEHCKPGCIDANRPECHKKNQFWRDENTCVEADDCPCMDRNEQYVQPHMPVVGEWDICQCIDNAYTCVPTKIEQIEINNVSQRTVEEKNITLVFPPSTITPPVQCSPERLIPMIQGDEPLPDTVFSGSTELGPDHAAHKARLYKNPADSTGAWSPSINDQMQYLQIEFEHPEPLFGIIVAGSPDFDNYLTLFKLLYSIDGEAYHYLVDETDNPQMFYGPMDSRSTIQTLFKIPVEAKSVRIYPLKWRNSIALRAELLGCGTHIVTTTTEQPYEKLVHETTTRPGWEDKNECTTPMGIENGAMHPKQVGASSIWQSPKPAKKQHLIDYLKLSSPLGWRPTVNTPNQFIEFDFTEPRNISGVITKGGPDGWVTGYKVLFSKNKKIWNNILNFDGRPKIFTANHDKDTEQVNYFRTPILTQYFKIAPAQWEENINMRIEPVGCFTPYLEIKEETPKVEILPSKCLVCDGVIDPTPDPTFCKCTAGLYWDGSTCVQSNLCPCVENFIIYPIGSKFENKKCEECVCVLGGHSNCKPKKCPPCGENLRATTTSGCYCSCEPCPPLQRLCPSSGDCIAEILWCNGVRNCADDEDDSCNAPVLEFTPKPDITNHTTVVVTCPAPICPPQMSIKLMEKKTREMSSMFSSTFSKRITMTNDGNKITRTKVITSTEEFLPLPSQGVDIQEEQECAEFTCVPIPQKVVNKNVTITCPDPKCPENYDIELDMSSIKPGDCKKYSCVLRPTKDVVCEIIGKAFTTFDGTEFVYPTCSHILARDIVESGWVISVHLQCTDETRKVCRKMITIKDIAQAAILTIMPNMMLNFNGFEYTVQQLINSPVCKASFVISQPGNTVLIVSRRHGFWVLYDDIGYIKIGVSSKYIKTVDGLCGFYNGIPGDDKRTPEGVVLSNTVKFGDSWFDKQVPKEECYPQTCTMENKKKALSLCNTVKHPTFVKCGKSVNYKQFASKCMETTCECLMTNNGDINACKCNILQDFVKKCVTVNPNVQLNTWRAVHHCEISCPAPLVHSDCYKRRCELSCDTLNSDDCPIIPDTCFSGCYCPEGTVRKGDTCLPINECKDCVCNAFGTSKYFTYDRNSFNFNGNCTYLLSRDIVLPGVHTFQVYVSMDDCSKYGIQVGAHATCAKALHVIHGDHVIHIQRIPNKPRALKLLVDGFELDTMSRKDSWINLQEVNGNQLLLALPEAHIELLVTLESLEFSLSVPSIIYGSKMEGLCGDCNGNPANDLIANPAMKKGKNLELVDVINSWKAKEMKLGLDANECDTKQIELKNCTSPPPEKDPCMMLYNAELFGRCNNIIDPTMYVSACQQDICKPGSQQNSACETLNAYAKACAKQGICLNWRRPDICPYECPPNMIYQTCGCAKTCDTIKAMGQFDVENMKTNSVVQTVTSDDMCEEHFEGCFCRQGEVMEHGVCIPEKNCIKCEDLMHVPGEKWSKDKCTECMCSSQGKTECVEKTCLVEENICAVGQKPQKIVADGECCPRYICVPDIHVKNDTVCLQPLMPSCGPGQFKKAKTDPNTGCLQYICECKPLEDCDPLELPRSLKPGEKVVKEDTGCCPTQKIVCDDTLCEPAPLSCTKKFYEVVSQQELTDCCPSYQCLPPKDACIVQYFPDDSSVFRKTVAEKWIHPEDPCKSELCTYGPDGFPQVITTEQGCAVECAPGFTYTKLNPAQCCGECVQTECVFDTELYKPEERWTSADNCTTYYCEKTNNMLMVRSTVETCPDVSACAAHLLYEEGCCKYCKLEPIIDNQQNCLPISLAENETRNLVKVRKAGHGSCINVEPILGFTECKGSCDSGSKYNAATFTQDKVCNCCSIRAYQTISVPLVCEDGSKITKELDIPSACGCSPCADSATYQVDDMIDLRLSPLPLAQLITHQRH